MERLWLWLTLFATGAVLSARADLPVEFVARGVSVAQVRERLPGVDARSLFAPSEREVLRSLGRGLLAEAVVLGPVPLETVEGLRQRWSREFPGSPLETNASVEVELGARESFPQGWSSASSTNRSSTDPLFLEQWALKNLGRSIRVDLDDLRTQEIQGVVGEDLRLPEGLDFSRLREVKVAVLDTGFDITHPDLTPRLHSKRAECENLARYFDCRAKSDEKACLATLTDLDADGNGYPLDCHGWSVVGNFSAEKDSPMAQVLGTPQMSDELGHGTHVAGIIGAQLGNAVGVRGIAPHVKLIPVQVIQTPPSAPVRPQGFEAGFENQDPSPLEKRLQWGKTSVDLIARGMLYAIREGAQVINLSLGWPSALDSSVMREMVALAQSKGILVVAASGNDSTDALVQPCSYPGVVCVGAFGPDGKLAHYSNRGAGVEVNAPGTSILSTYPLGLRPFFFTDLLGYEFRSGTSMATPFVSGALAVLLGRGLSPREALARVLSTLRSDERGEKKLDLGAALAVRERPVYRVRERAPLKLRWKALEDSVPGHVELESLWGSSRACAWRIRADVETAKDFEVGGAGSCLEAGPSSAALKLPFEIRARSWNASRELTLIAEIEAVDASGRQVRQSLSFAVEWVPTPELVDSRLPRSTYAIVGKPMGKAPSARSLGDAIEADLPSYLVTSTLPDGPRFQILAPVDGAYRYSEFAASGIQGWDLLAAQRYLSGEARAPRVGFVFRKKNELSGLTDFKIQVYDGELKNWIRTYEVDGSIVPFPENFRWTTQEGKDAIFFIARGKGPARPEDYWNPVADEIPRVRAYLLNAEGALRELILDRHRPDRRIVQFLPELSDDVAKGEIPVLIVQGRDYVVNYSVGKIRDGVLASETPFRMNPYRNVGGLAISSVLTDSADRAVRAYTGQTGRGRMRTSYFERTAKGTISSRDFRFEPLSALDGLTRLAGAYAWGGRDAFFVQTNWDLQYHEAGRTLKTSLKRFSFMPRVLFQKGFFPVWVRKAAMGVEPAILVMDIGKDELALHAVVPERDSTGEATRLVRPAILSFEPAEGCTLLGNPVRDSRTGGYRLNSFCGREIRSLLLEMPGS